MKPLNVGRYMLRWFDSSGVFERNSVLEKVFNSTQLVSWWS